MKKIILKFLITVLLFSGISCAIFHGEEYADRENSLQIHVHEIKAETYVTNSTCPGCNKVLHLDNVLAAPTCTEAGLGTGHCASQSTPLCPSEGIEVSIVPLGHSYQSKVAKEPTCTEAGSRRYVCVRCSSAYSESIPALGHNYQETITQQPTCTQEGTSVFKCSRCGSSYTSYPAALGHSYKVKESREATCEEEGYTKYVCSRCSSSYEKKTNALGHDIAYEEKEPTCLEEGYRKGTCKRCGREESEILPALGHDLSYTILKAPTCEEEGEREALCQRCNESWKEKILPAGHRYPPEWTLEKQATYLEEGLESKKCYYCDHVIYRSLPRKNSVPIIAAATGAVAALAGGLFFWLRKRRLPEKAKDLRKLSKPSFKDRSILVSSKDEDLLVALKSKSFLEVSTCDSGEIEETIGKDSPDLLIIDVLSEERLEDFLVRKQEELREQPVAIMTTESFISDHREKLDSLVKEKKIINYLPYASDRQTVMMKFILPILKPDLKSDEALSNIGAVADFIGIPGVSKVIDLYTSGKDIKSALEEEEFGISETATVISDIASILGLDTVASVAGLVDDIDSIRAAVDKEAGAHEHKDGISGAKDIVEVVGEIIDKD